MDHHHHPLFPKQKNTCNQRPFNPTKIQIPPLNRYIQISEIQKKDKAQKKSFIASKKKNPPVLPETTSKNRGILVG
jgi:hypothetical protein